MNCESRACRESVPACTHAAECGGPHIPPPGRRKVWPTLCDSHRMSCRHRFRLRTEDKLGVAELTHFRNVQTRHLGFRRNPVPDKDLKHPVEKETEGENEAKQS